MVLQMQTKQKIKHLENTEVKHKLVVSTFYPISGRLWNKASSDQENAEEFLCQCCVTPIAFDKFVLDGMKLAKGIQEPQGINIGMGN